MGCCNSKPELIDRDISIKIIDIEEAELKKEEAERAKAEARERQRIEKQEEKARLELLAIEEAEREAREREEAAALAEAQALAELKEQNDLVEDTIAPHSLSIDLLQDELKSRKSSAQKKSIAELNALDGKQRKIIHISAQKRQYLLPDKYLEFINNGGDLAEVIKNYTVPRGWDEEQANEFRLGIVETTRDGETCFAGTIHMNDNEPMFKRHILAFFDLKMQHISPDEFANWCFEYSMHNTMADYLGLYFLSKNSGPGSNALRAVTNLPGAIGIEVSDRFMTAKGMLRAIRFLAVNRRQTVVMFKQYLGSIDIRANQGGVVEYWYPDIEDTETHEEENNAFEIC